MVSCFQMACSHQGLQFIALGNPTKYFLVNKPMHIKFITRTNCREWPLQYFPSSKVVNEWNFTVQSIVAIAILLLHYATVGLLKLKYIYKMLKCFFFNFFCLKHEGLACSWKNKQNGSEKIKITNNHLSLSLFSMH